MAAEDRSDHTMIEEISEESQSKTAGRGDVRESDTFNYSSWQKTDGAGGNPQNFSVSVFHRTVVILFCDSR